MTTLELQCPNFQRKCSIALALLLSGVAAISVATHPIWCFQRLMNDHFQIHQKNLFLVVDVANLRLIILRFGLKRGAFLNLYDANDVEISHVSRQQPSYSRSHDPRLALVKVLVVYCHNVANQRRQCHNSFVPDYQIHGGCAKGHDVHRRSG